MWSTVAIEAYGNEKGLLAGVKAKNVQSGEVTDLQVGRL